MNTPRSPSRMKVASDENDIGTDVSPKYTPLAIRSRHPCGESERP
jgi:hypothetical protein